MSARKVGLVVNLIRGLGVIEAQRHLEFLNKAAAKPILKLLNSAIANATNIFGLDKSNLFIVEIRVDPGPTLKRWRARARGRAAPIMKRTSHITIVLDEKVKSEIKKKEKKIEEAKRPEITIEKEAKRPEKKVMPQKGRFKGFKQKFFQRKSI